jgi:ubiquinone/menaquinone biosynthesis C-methylase UbiE
MYTRYRFAADFCRDKEVLEVACGSGQGLGYLARYAKKIVGGDCDDNILKYATSYYRNSIEIHKLDAHSLPFEDNSFDVIILYEAIYYLADPNKFIKEAKRILRENGLLIIGAANREWAGFNPSPHSYTYFSANELFSFLTAEGFKAEMFADCPQQGLRYH